MRFSCKQCDRRHSCYRQLQLILSRFFCNLCFVLFPWDPVAGATCAQHKHPLAIYARNIAHIQPINDKTHQ